MNAGLLLLAPFASLMRDEHRLMIAPEVDEVGFYANNRNSGTGDRFG